MEATIETLRKTKTKTAKIDYFTKNHLLLRFLDNYLKISGSVP